MIAKRKCVEVGFEYELYDHTYSEMIFRVQCSTTFNIYLLKSFVLQRKDK